MSIRPMLVAFAFALGFLLLNIHKPLHIRGGSGGSVCPQLVLDRQGFSLFCGSGGMGLRLGDGTNRYAPLGVLFQNGKDSDAVKIVAQLPGGNGLCPVRRKVGQPPPALLDGHALPQQQRGKVLE